MLNSLVRVSRRIEWNETQTPQPTASAGEQAPRPRACFGFQYSNCSHLAYQDSKRLATIDHEGRKQPTSSRTFGNQATRCGGGRRESRLNNTVKTCTRRPPREAERPKHKNTMLSNSECPLTHDLFHSFTSEQFHALLNSLFKVLFNFPSRYLFAIGLAGIFSLGWSIPPI